MGEISMTLSSTHIELENGRGAISASVTNASTEPQQLILAAFEVAGPPAQDDGDTGTSRSPGAQDSAGTGPTSWVTVENPHRSIAPGKTEQFTVTFDGTGRTAGPYTVKLIAYSADENPEDNRGESETVTVVVKDAPPPPPTERKIPWWVFVVVAVVVLGIGAAVSFLLGRDPEVPDVVGRPVGEAVATLAEEDFRVAADFEYVQSDEPADTVLSQEPAAGVQAESGSTVALTLAAPRTAEVPDVDGELATVASERLLSTGLTPFFFPEMPCTATQNSATCRVTDQVPEPGTEMPLNSRVALLTDLPDRPVCQPIILCLPNDFELKQFQREALPDELEKFRDEDVLDFREDQFLELEQRVR